MNEIETKWRKTGLLGNVEPDSVEAAILSQSLNDAAIEILAECSEPCGSGFNDLQEFKAGVFLPIVCRLFQSGHRLLNMKGLYDNFSQYVKDNLAHIDIFSSDSSATLIESYLEYICTDDRIELFFPQ